MSPHLIHPFLKSSRSAFRPCGVLLVLLLSALASPAQTYVWDPNGSGGGTGGTGTWDTTSLYWDNGTSSWPTSGASNIASFGGTAGTVTLTSGLVANGLSFSTTGYTLTGGSLAFNGVNPTIDSSVTATITDVPITAGSLTKTGTGAVSITSSSAANATAMTSALSGLQSITVSQGTLTFGVANSQNQPSLPAGLALTVASGATFSAAVTNLFSGSNNLNLSSLNNAGTIQLTQTGGSTSITLNNADASTFSGSFSGTNSMLTKNGAGSLAITSAAGFSRNIVHNSGTITLSQSGTLVNYSNVAGYALGTGATLTLDNSATNANRLRDTNTVVFNSTGGNLNLIGNSSAASDETVGNLTLSTGNTVMTVTPGSGQSASLTFGTATANRSGTGTALFRGTGLGSVGANTSRILFGAAPTLTNGILPWAVADTSASGAGSYFATYDSNGVQALTAGYIGYNASGSVTDNIRETSSVTTTSSKTINSLTVDASGSPTTVTNTGNTITVGSGGVLLSGNQSVSISGGTLAFGAAQAIFHATSSASSTISASLTGSGGWVKAGSGTLALTSPVSSITGVVSLNAGVLEAAVMANGLSGSSIGGGGAAATNLFFNGGALRYTGTGHSSNRLFTLGLSGGTLEASGTGALNMNGSGSIGLTGTNVSRTFTLGGTNTGANTFAPTLGNNGTGNTILSKTGAGTWILTAANTYSGGTTVTAGTLLVNNTTGSGTGTGAVNVSAGTLGGTGTISGAVTVGSAGFISPGSSPGNLTLGGGLDLSSGGTYVWELAAFSESSPGTDFDVITLTDGNLGLGGTSKVTLSFISGVTDPDGGNAFWGSNRTWKIIDITGSATNAGSTNIASITNGVFAAGSFSTAVGTGADLGDIYLVYTVIPEPSSLALLALAGSLLWVTRRRRD
ncbi:MAG: autotransporter-associated beta strand repeat-containing protein [Terrimicrobiaceae bacterium]|nr:autotransporter-associated beta strand repeat-containing protein [Terrimicrobiaceae bacterium]